MATPRSWSSQIALQGQQSLNRQHGFAQVVDGKIFYSPNCNRKISTPSSISDPKTLKDHIFLTQNPHWWNQKFPYLPFTPFLPRYTNVVPFQHLSCIPHQHEVCPEGKRMPLTVQSQWKTLETSLVKATCCFMAKHG